MNNKKPKNQPKQYINKNPLEALRDIGGGVKKSLTNDVLKGASSDLFAQMLGVGNYEAKSQQETSGDLEEGQELNLKDLSRKQKEDQGHFADIEPGIDYRRQILHGERRIVQDDRRHVETKIQEIIIELKRLTSSSKMLAMEFKEVSVEQRVVNPGEYHINFFEWVLSLVKTARMRVEDSGAWLASFKSKKAKRQYWNMFKKHGTTFGLSNERVVATQTG